MKFPSLFQPRRTVSAPKDVTVDFFSESLILDHLDCALALFDDAGQLLRQNPAWADLEASALPPGSCTRCREATAAFIQNKLKNTHDGDSILLTCEEKKDRCTCQLRCREIPHGDKRFFLLIREELRAEKETLRALHESEQRYTEMSEGKKAAETQREILYQAMEQASESVVITDRTGSILYVNQGFVTASGYSREEALGQNPRVLKSGKQGPEFYAEMWKTLNAGATWTGRFINRRKDNSEYTEEAVISPVRDEGGNIRHFVAVKRDVTHELELAKQLRLAQRMETVGRLAGGIAHDFNNILTIILGNISYLEFTLPEDLPARTELAQISQAARRAADLTRQLLSFSRKQVIAPRQLDLNTLLEGLEKMLRRVLPENIRLEAVPHPQPLPVFADPGQIEQVVLNLALNARDAMPTGGTLRVSSGQARPETDPDTWFNDAPADPSREMAFIEVSDTGPGIPDEIRGKIFEPFFTTKEVGQGSGLGLSTAYGIAQQHRGSLSLRNAPQGACFALWLPLHAPQIPTPSKSPSALVMPSGQETLLMVEDEPMVLNIAARVLRGLGYQVLEAETARKALDTARNYEGPIHLLLTDVVMPEMSGMDLAKTFAMLRPDTPVLFASGYPREELDAQGLAQGELRLIQKPFNREELASAIRAVIDGKPLPLRSR